MEVKVKVHTIQYNEYGDRDDIEVINKGTLYQKNNHIYVLYKENEKEKETTTSIKIEDDKVTIKRFGEINTTMIFEKEKTINSVYRTPQGIFEIELKTNKLDIKNKNEIEINVDYSIEIKDLFKGKNSIKINIYK